MVLFNYSMWFFSNTNVPICFFNITFSCVSVFTVSTIFSREYILRKRCSLIYRVSFRHDTFASLIKSDIFYVNLLIWVFWMQNPILIRISLLIFENSIKKTAKQNILIFFASSTKDRLIIYFIFIQIIILNLSHKFRKFCWSKINTNHSSIIQQNDILWEKKTFKYI